MIKIGLTGGIASGKSTISKLFKELGIPVFNSDLSGREAENDPDIQRGIKEVLGDDIFIDGVLDRPKMRSIVFVDKAKLAEISKLIGPYIKASFNKFIEDNSGAPYVMLESAILFENGNDTSFDYIITVTADMDTRIKRAMKRDNSSFEEVVNKINNQLSDQDKIAKSKFVIYNNYENLIDAIPELTNKVCEIDKIILEETVEDLTKVKVYVARCEKCDGVVLSAVKESTGKDTIKEFGVMMKYGCDIFTTNVIIARTLKWCDDTCEGMWKKKKKK